MPAARLQATATANVTYQGEQLSFDAILKAVDAANTRLKAQHARQERALRSLFKANGFDLEAGDMMFHAPGVKLDIPPQRAAQVRQNAFVEAGTFLFMKNPRFSLF
jgi:hypothetical protein